LSSGSSLLYTSQLVDVDTTMIGTTNSDEEEEVVSHHRLNPTSSHQITSNLRRLLTRAEDLTSDTQSKRQTADSVPLMRSQTNSGRQRNYPRRTEEGFDSYSNEPEPADDDDYSNEPEPSEAYAQPMDPWSEPSLPPSGDHHDFAVPTTRTCTGHIFCSVGTDILFVSSILLLLCLPICLRFYRSLCQSYRDDQRGGYRMVAAQYTESAFDDGLTEEDYDVFSDEEEETSNDWKTNGKRRSIEMMGIEEELNGGLTLEEMNG